MTMAEIAELCQMLANYVTTDKLSIHKQQAD